MSNLLDFNFALESKNLLIVWHECHRCNSGHVIPQHIEKEKDLLEKDCPICGKTVAIW